jgi:hypothetical protein
MTNKELPKDTMHYYDVTECVSSVDVRLHLLRQHMTSTYWAVATVAESILKYVLHSSIPAICF